MYLLRELIKDINNMILLADLCRFSSESDIHSNVFDANSQEELLDLSDRED
jgi:hypothetical protein